MNKKKKKDKSSREIARQRAISSGKRKVGDGKEVDHKDNNPQNNSKKNIRIVSSTTNKRKGAKKANKNRK